MSSNQITNLLTIILCVMIGILFLLSVIYIVLKLREILYCIVKNTSFYFINVLSGIP